MSGMHSKLANADMRAAPGALLRAADRAREIARQTGTPIVIVRDGILMEVDPDSPLLDSDSDHGAPPRRGE
jgi:hypothetical protein